MCLGESSNEFRNGKVKAVCYDFKIAQADFAFSTFQVGEIGAIESEMFSQIRLCPAALDTKALEGSAESNRDILCHGLILACRL